jgi:hypothetical protein
MPQIDGRQEDISWDYTGVFSPWFSLPLGQRSELYLSGGLNLKYEESDGWIPLPELYRFEAVLRTSAGLEFRLGRQRFQDALGLVAGGLFDGFTASATLDLNRLYGGVYYTGFLNKRTASITMTQQDEAIYQAAVETVKDYFAPSRALASLGWERRELLVEGSVFSLALLGQFDLGAQGYHTQYLMARYLLPLPASLQLDLGGGAELIETGDTVDPLQWGAAAQALLGWKLPIKAVGRLSLGARWASGEGDVLAAFAPISSVTQGRVLQAKFSGLLTLEGICSIRLGQPLAMELSAFYFLRTDTETFPTAVGDSPFLGAEISGLVTWAPLSDFSLVGEAGVFLPQPGGAYPTSRLQWRGGISLMLSLY